MIPRFFIADQHWFCRSLQWFCDGGGHRVNGGAAPEISFDGLWLVVVFTVVLFFILDRRPRV